MLCAWNWPCRAAVEYSVTDLGTLGGNSSTPTAINNAGWIVGLAYTTFNSTAHAFLYKNKHMTDLGQGLGESSTAGGINKNGLIAGSYTVTPHTPPFNPVSYPFAYDGTNLNVLPNLYPTDGMDANAINDLGEVVGTSHGQHGNRGYLYSNGATIDLGTLGTETYAIAINNHSQVVGTSLRNATTPRAFLYTRSGGITDLGTLSGGATSGAWGINDAGQIVGQSDAGGGPNTGHPFLYSNGHMTDLGSLGGSNANALGINNLGEVVGWCNIPGDGAAHAFRYTAGVMTDLNLLVAADPNWTLQEATAINDLGQIVAVKVNAAGEGQAVLLDPVPEPSAPAALAIVAMAACIRRRARGSPHRHPTASASSIGSGSCLRWPG
jgi:probable HAF family extracellular repeat protein